ncbi:MAG: MarR family transcriptional regulator [Robiginitomaculum sp.]|nr:MarR family transcriptional regulator [Robiginitomaculum sp.]MDQ7077827.1 MarR family transcriptional regulator [Robiginitomaculum sp.]
MTDGRDTLRAWLTLLNASNAIKKSVDAQLRTRFGVSISRFDVMSALQRCYPEGLRAGELSRQLMVTEGNTTQVTAPLIRDGFVKRRVSPKDARGVIFSLTPEGVSLFNDMAAEHKEWIHEAFARLNSRDLSTLRALLDQLEPDTNTKRKSE